MIKLSQISGKQLWWIKKKISPWIYETTFRAPRYLEKTEYIQFNLDTPLTFPGNGQHQRKTGKTFFVRDRDIVYDWYNAYFRVNFKFQTLADGTNVAGDTRSTPSTVLFPW